MGELAKPLLTDARKVRRSVIMLYAASLCFISNFAELYATEAKFPYTNEPHENQAEAKIY